MPARLRPLHVMVRGFAGAMKRTHKNLDFIVFDHEIPASGPGCLPTYGTFGEAAGVAAARSASHGRPVTIGVIAWNRAAAVAYGGDHSGEEYDADPDASWHDQITIRAESTGRIA